VVGDTLSVMAFTVVPLNNLRLPPGTRIPFANDFVLQDLPEWVKSDKGTLDSLYFHDRQHILDAKHALVAEYEAEAIGQPDPQWKGTKPKSIQDLKCESAILANLALWLRQPSPVRFTVGFHTLLWPRHGQSERSPIIQRIEPQSPLFCHPKDFRNPVNANHVIEAAELHVALSQIPRNNRMWEALRATWAGLTMYDPDRRYPFFWMALESLFGRDKPDGHLTRKLSRRIAFFLADNYADTQALFDMTMRCYDMRSKIVHGRWDNDPKIDSVMAETEAIIRTSLRNIMADPKAVATFLSTRRDKFLSDLITKKSKRMPPLIEPQPSGNIAQAGP
jgi:Apea-like HEPN